ncbi:MAG: hypothetical protein U0840_22300 [Gemmataceae bacterium]
MIRFLVLALLTLVLLTPAPVEAGRVPSAKTQIVPANGARPDIYFPYTTNGRNNLGVWNGVQPWIYDQTAVGTNKPNAQGKPVYNLIYYGSSTGNSSDFNGAMPRQPNQLRPTR